MEKHSLWEMFLTVLANLVSKFVTDERIVIRDSKHQEGTIRCTVSKPFQITRVNYADGTYQIIIVEDPNISKGGDKV